MPCFNSRYRPCFSRNSHLENVLIEAPTGKKQKKMFFSEIIGQEDVKLTLRQMVSNNKLAHAVLLSGKEGVGHLGLALALASYLLCENRAESDSCGVCTQCKRSHKHLHPDIHYAFPVVKKGDKKREDTFSNDFLVEWRRILEEGPYFNEAKWLSAIGAADRQGDINTRECLEIVKILSLKSFGDNQKILILWLPEYLGKNGNRLLKLIEEPPDDTYLFLVTNQQDKILNTILSRCQIISVPSILDKDLAAYVHEQTNLSEKEIQKLVFISDGNLNATKELLEGENHENISEAFFNWIKISFKGDAGKIVQWVVIFSGKSTEWQKQFFRFGLSFFRELLVSQIIGLDKTKLTDDELLFGTQILKVLDMDKIRLLQEKFDLSIYSIERNINSKILMMSCSLTIGQILRKKKKTEFIN